MELSINHRQCGDDFGSPKNLIEVDYFPSLIRSAIRSPITITVTLVFALMQSGMIEASATHAQFFD